MTEPPDAELAIMMVGGSSRAFERLYLRHADAVHRQALTILACSEAADEVVQETFLQLWRRGAVYSSEHASMRTWLLTIARNRAIDMVRAQVRHTDKVEAAREVARRAAPPPGPLAETIARDEVARVIAAVVALPPAQRRALILSHGGDLTDEEVARRTQAPVGTIKSRLRAGRATIAQRLSPGARVEGPLGA